MPTLGQLGRAKSGLSSDALSELLRQREQAQASGQAEPGLRDIYQYVSNQGAGSFFISPNEQNGGESGMGSSATVPWQTITHGAGDNAWTEQMPGVDPRFAGVVRFASNAGHSNEGSGSWRAEVDGSKLPTTRFGDVTRTAPVNAHTPLFNPALVYDDPQYGRITDARNVRPDKLNQMVGMMLPSLAMGGIGLLGAPALGTQLVGLARALGNGGNGLGNLIGILGGQFGLPSWATSLAQLGARQIGGR